MTYDTWYTKYITVYKAKRKPRTLEEYNRLHRSIIAPVLGPVELGDVSPEDVQVCLNAAAERGGRTADAVYTLIRAVMRRAVRSRLLSWSPVDAVDPPQHDEALGVSLTAADYAAALPRISDDVGLSLALMAGLRRGELAGLQWGDVDLRARRIHVQRIRQRIDGQLVTGSTKSTAGERIVPISPELLPILRAAYRLAPAAWVCPCAPETHDRRWQRIQQRDVLLSQHYRLHDLRHTYVSRLLLAGTIPRVVQYLAGHSSIDMTMRIYAHVTPEDAARELERVAASLH